MPNPSMTINRWPIAALFAYAAMKKLGLGEGKYDRMIRAVAAEIATSGAVRKNAAFGKGDKKKRTAKSMKLKDDLDDSTYEEFSFSGFNLKVRQEGKSWVAVGWADSKETDDTFDRKVMNALNHSTGGRWKDILAAAMKIVDGRERIDIFQPRGGAYMMVRDTCASGRRIDLAKMLEL